MLTIGQCIKINAMIDEGLVGVDDSGHLVSPNEPICVEQVIRTCEKETGEPITFLRCHFMDDDYCIGYLETNVRANYFRKVYSNLNDMPYVRHGVASIFRNYTIPGTDLTDWLYDGYMNLNYEPITSQGEIINSAFDYLFGCKKFPIIFQEDE